MLSNPSGLSPDAQLPAPAAASAAAWPRLPLAAGALGSGLLAALASQLATAPVGVALALVLAWCLVPMPLLLGVWAARQMARAAEQAQSLAGQAAQLALARAQLQQLQLAEQVVALGSFDWNPLTGTLFWSEGHYRLWGRQPGTLVPDYTVFRQGVHPDDVAELESHLQRALREGGHYDFRHRVCWPDGTVRQVHARGDVTLDGLGRAARMLGTVQDITDALKAQAHLQLHQFVFNTITEPVSVVDADGVYRLVNEAWTRATGTAAAAIVDQPASTRVPGLSSPERSAMQARCMATGEVQVLLTELDLPGQGRRWWETTLFPLGESRTGWRGVVKISRDVTARQTAGRTLAASVDNLRLTLNATGDAVFASDANDPREPLLFVNDRMLQMWRIPPDRAAGLTPADVMAHARPFFVNPEREFARVAEVIASRGVQEDRLTLNDGRVLLRRCIPADEAGRQVRVWGFRDITVEARALAGLRAAEAQQRALLAAFPGYIACLDAGLHYLYVNARLATLLGGTPESLVGRSLAALATPERLPQLSRQVARALDGEVVRFERHHPAQADQPEVHVLITLARGLDRQTGQAVCYAFGTDITPQKHTEAALLAARDEAEAAMRRLATAQAAPAALPKAPTALVTGTPQPQAAAVQRPGRVLYIEDNAANTLLMKILFERLPQLQLQCEAQAEVGLASALADPPDLVLLDIQMPVLDGYEVLRRLRASPHTRHLPVVAVTANAMPQDQARGLAAGFDDYLTKPLELPRLMALVAALLPAHLPAQLAAPLGGPRSALASSDTH